MALPTDVLQRTSKWIPWLAATWHEEVPIKMHYRDQFDEHGDPALTAEFSAWLYGVRRNSERRTRLTSAMRKMRRLSIREYEVAYRIIVNGERVEDTTKWLNERAIRNGKKDRYSVQDTTAIIVSAVDKLLAWW